MKATKWKNEHYPADYYFYEETSIMMPKSILEEGFSLKKPYYVLMNYFPKTTPEDKDTIIHKMEKGRYIRVYINSFVKVGSSIINGYLKDFIKTNNLTVTGNLLIFPVTDFHTVNTTTEKKYQLLIPV